MSIWASIFEPDGQPDVLERIPERETYTGDIDQDSTIRYMLDVATARSWHDRIRFTARMTPSLDSFGNEVEMLLAIDEARELVRRLTTAIDYIEARP